jgi:L-asparaginase II
MNRSGSAPRCCHPWANGWPLAGYAEPGHPVQVAIRAAVEDLAGWPVTAVAVDGRGAPLFGLKAGLAARCPAGRGRAGTRSERSPTPCGAPRPGRRHRSDGPR